MVNELNNSPWLMTATEVQEIGMTNSKDMQKLWEPSFPTSKCLITMMIAASRIITVSTVVKLLSETII